MSFDVPRPILEDLKVAPAKPHTLKLVVIDPRDVDAARTDVDHPEDWVSFRDPDLRRILLRIDNNYTALDVEGDDEDFLVQIASELQDYVVDNSGAAWPQVTVNEESVVLDVGLTPQGKAAWMRSGVVICLVGELQEQVVHQG